MRFPYVNFLPETLCTTAVLSGSWSRNARKICRFGREDIHREQLGTFELLKVMVGIEIEDSGLHRTARRIDIRLCRSMLGDGGGDVSESEIRGTVSHPKWEAQRFCFF